MYDNYEIELQDLQYVLFKCMLLNICSVRKEAAT